MKSEGDKTIYFLFSVKKLENVDVILLVFNFPSNLITRVQ